jgi:hypothetical protein
MLLFSPSGIASGTRRQLCVLQDERARKGRAVGEKTIRARERSATSRKTTNASAGDCGHDVDRGYDALGGDGSASRRVVGTGAAVDFVYAGGAPDVMVRFGLAQSCEKPFLEPIFGLKIDGVMVDGRRVSRSHIRESAIDDGDLILDRPGLSFRYLLSLKRLQSIDAVKPRFSGEAFPVPSDPVPDIIEIHYCIRCPDGKLGPPLVSRGLRI